MRLMTQLTSDAVLEEAYAWLCRARCQWPDHADVWDLRRHWPREKTQLEHALHAGTSQPVLPTLSHVPHPANQGGLKVTVPGTQHATAS